MEKRSIVEKYLKIEDHLLSCYSFANLFAWEKFFTFEVELMDGYLCIFASNEAGVFLYLPPLGNRLNSSIVNKCLGILQEKNNSGVTRIENIDGHQKILLGTGEYAYSRKDDEYLYFKKDIISLKGNRYKSKRSSVNQFRNNNRYRYCCFEESMAEECNELYRRWSVERKINNSDEIYVYMLEENKIVHANVINNYSSLGLTGSVVIIGGLIKGYIFGYAINESVFCVLFEVVDLNVKGLGAFIFSEFCRDVRIKQYRFINVMDDFGADNLKGSKMSFRPVALISSYSIKKADLNG